ncbi:MAG: PilX N-terminal domain-containing pilus assembly protein [Blastocatellia bacterium]
MMNNHLQTERNNERGVALVTCILLTLLLSLLTAAMLMASTTDVLISGNDIRTNQAFYVAESGIHRAAGWFTSKFGADPNTGLYILPAQYTSNTAGVAGQLSYTNTPFFQSAAAATSADQTIPTSVKVLNSNVLKNVVLAGDSSNTYPASYSLSANDPSGTSTTFSYNQVVNDFAGKLYNQTEGQGRFSVKAILVSIVPPSSLKPGSVTWLIQSTGTINRGSTTIASATLWAYISATATPITETVSIAPSAQQADAGAGLVARGMITMSGSGRIDSYHSSLGPYGTSLPANTYPGQIGRSNIGSRGDLRTNNEFINNQWGYINVNTGTITGQAYATLEPPYLLQPSGFAAIDIDLTGNKVKDGHGNSFSASSEHLGESPLIFNNVPPPPAPSGTTDYSWSKNQAGTLPAGNYHDITVSQGSLTIPPGNYGTITTSASSVIYLGTPGQTTVYNLQSLNTSSSSKIIFKGPVTFNIAGSSTMSGSSGLQDPNLKPTDVHWNFTGGANQTVTLSGNSDTYGIVYAPHSQLNISGSGDFYGSFVGATVAISGNGAVHIDEDASSGVLTTIVAATTSTNIIGYSATNFSLWRITQALN